MNPPASAALKPLASRLLTVQRGASRNPRRPDLEGLGKYLRRAALRAGVAYAPWFGRTVPGRQGAECQILKHQRVESDHDFKNEKDERQSDKAPKGGGMGGDQ